MRLPWSPSNVKNDSLVKIKQPSPEDPKLDLVEEDVRHLSRAWGELRHLSFGAYPLLGLGAFVLFSVGWGAHRKWDSIYSRYFKRIRRHYDVPDPYIREKRFLKGIVTEVPDGDGFLFLHTPGPGWRWPLKFRRLPKLKPSGPSQVMRMRMAAIDAPEVGKGTAEGQPFSIESRDWLRNQILGKTIYCQLFETRNHVRTDDSPLVLAAEIFAMVADWKPWDQHIGGEPPAGLGIRLRTAGRGVSTPREEGVVHEVDDRSAEGKSWDVEARDFIGDTRTIQETKARRCTWDNRQRFGGAPRGRVVV